MILIDHITTLLEKQRFPPIAEQMWQCCHKCDAMETEQPSSHAYYEERYQDGSCDRDGHAFQHIPWKRLMVPDGLFEGGLWNSFPLPNSCQKPWQFFLAMPPYSFAWQGADCWILMFPAWVDVWYFTGLRQTTGRTMGTSTLLVQMHSNFSWKNCWMPITSTFVHWVAKKFPVFSDSWLSNEVDVLKEDFSWGRQHRLKAKSRPKQSESWPILKRGASSCWAFFWFVALAQRFGQIFFSAIARVISPASYECIPPISQEEVTTHWWFKWIGWGCSLLIG